MSSGRGLCGVLERQFVRTVVEQVPGLMKKALRSHGIDGNKKADRFRSVGANVIAVMPDVGETPLIADLIGGIRVMLDAYSEGKIDRLFLASSDFENTMTQTPTVRQLLPLNPSDDSPISTGGTIYMNLMLAS